MVIYCHPFLHIQTQVILTSNVEVPACEEFNMLENSKHRKILVVDDDPFMREVLCQTLIASDYVVFSAENGAMALAHDSLTDLNLIIYERDRNNQEASRRQP